MGSVLGSVSQPGASEATLDTAGNECLPLLRADWCPVECRREAEQQQQCFSSFLRECCDVMESDAALKHAALAWTIPTGVTVPSLITAGGCEAGDAQLLARLLSHGGTALHRLSLAGHEEVSGAAVAAWTHAARKLHLTSTLRSSLLLCTSLCVLDFSDCPLADCGVACLMKLLFPPVNSDLVSVVSARGSPRRCASQREGTVTDANLSTAKVQHLSSSSRVPQQRLLPSLHTLVLDGVGLTDAGLTALCAVGEGERSSALPAADAPLLHLSVRRNSLSLGGVARLLLCACLSDEQDGKDGTGAMGGVRSLPPLGTVDASWTFRASGSSGSSSKSRSTDAMCLRLLGQRLVRRSQCPIAAPLSASAVPLVSLLLRGCALQPCDMRALWTDGVLASYLDAFREAGKDAILSATSRAPSRASVPASPRPPHLLSCAALTRIDLSENAALGDDGVTTLLGTLLALETARQATTSSRAPSGLVPHALSFLEELSLRNTSCTDAVVPALVRLLMGNEKAGDAVLETVSTAVKKKGSPARSTLQGIAQEGTLERQLRAEALALTGMRVDDSKSGRHAADGDRQDAKTAGDMAGLARHGTFFLPYLRLLDVSGNTFADPALTAAMVVGAVLRAPLTRASHTQGGVTTTGASAGGEEDRQLLGGGDRATDAAPSASFLLGLEDCCLTDATLLAVPAAWEVSLRAMAHTATASADALPDMTAQADGVSASVCCLFLGHNSLTHGGVLSLRRFFQQHQQQQWQRQNESAAFSLPSILRSGRIVCYVEGNTLAQPCLPHNDTPLDDTVSGIQQLPERARALGLETAGGKTTTASPLHSTHGRVSWTTLLTLPGSTASAWSATAASANARHDNTHLGWRSHDHLQGKYQTAPRQPESTGRAASLWLPSSPGGAAAHTSSERLYRGRRSESSAAHLSQSLDPEAYIDAFIAEAERVMGEREAIVAQSEEGEDGVHIERLLALQPQSTRYERKYGNK